MDQQERFEAAKARYLEKMPLVVHALAVLPIEVGNVYHTTFLSIMDMLENCPKHDTELVFGALKAMGDNIREQAAGKLAQAEIDAEMDAARAVVARERGELRQVA